MTGDKLYLNKGDLKFEDITTKAANLERILPTMGCNYGDLDKDGDQDIYAVMGGSYSGDVFQNALFENPGNDNNWISLRLEGTTSNRSAVGAGIKITIAQQDGTARDIYNTVSSGGSFGANSLQQEIRLGKGGSIKKYGC